MFARADNLKTNKCKLGVLDKETATSSHSNEATPNDDSTEIAEQPPNKASADVFPDEPPSVGKPPTKKLCLKSLKNSTHRGPNYNFINL